MIEEWRIILLDIRLKFENTATSSYKWTNANYFHNLSVIDIL